MIPYLADGCHVVLTACACVLTLCSVVFVATMLFVAVVDVLKGKS